MSVYEGAVFVMRATAWYCVLSISQPYMISCLNAEGSVLDIEPSMMRGVFVEGSGLENGTFHDFGLQRGGFAQQLVPPNSFAQTPESGDTAAVGC